MSQDSSQDNGPASPNQAIIPTHAPPTTAVGQPDAAQDNMVEGRQLLTFEQADQFWDQVYAFCFWIRGVPLPEEARRSALKWSAPSNRLIRSMSSTDYLDLSAGDEVDDEMLDEYSETQMRILHNLANGSASIRAEVPIPPKMRWRFEYARAMAGEPGYVTYSNATGNGRASSTGSSAGSMVAACICPYNCGMYTEDLSRFLEHLLDEHAVRVPVKEGPRKDSGYESGGDMETEDVVQAEPMPETEENVKLDKGKEKARAPDTESQQAQRTSACWKRLLTMRWSSLTSSPKKRRYEDDEQTQDVGAEEEAEGDSHPEKRQKVERLTPRLSPRTPRHFPLGTEAQADNFRHHMDGFYWANPYKVEKSVGSRERDGASPKGGAAGRETEGEMADAYVSGARDGGGDRRSGLGSASESRSESHVDLDDDNARFVCPHNENCKREFDSLVLFVEHLTERGYVTPGRPDEATNRTRVTSKSLLAEWNMSGL